MARLVSVELFHRCAPSWIDVAHPRRLTWLPFVLSGIAYALSTASADELKALHNWATSRAFDHQAPNGEPLLNPLLLQDPTLGTDSIGSFLGGDRGPKLAPLLGAERAAILSREILEQVVAHALDQLGEPGSEATRWTAVLLIVGDLPVYPSLGAKFERQIASLEIVPILKEDRRFGVRVLQAAATQVARLRLDAVRPRLLDQWFDAAVELSKIDPGDAGYQEGLAAIFEAAIELAATSVAPTTIAAEFARLLSRLMELPRLRGAPMVAGLVERLCTELPTDQALAFWSLRVRIRSERI